MMNLILLITHTSGEVQWFWLVNLYGTAAEENLRKILKKRGWKTTGLVISSGGSRPINVGK